MELSCGYLLIPTHPAQTQDRLGSDIQLLPEKLSALSSFSLSCDKCRYGLAHFLCTGLLSLLARNHSFPLQVCWEQKVCTVKDFSISKAGTISNCNENTIDHSSNRPFPQLAGLFYGEATFPEFADRESCLRLQQLHWTEHPFLLLDQKRQAILKSQVIHLEKS